MTLLFLSFVAGILTVLAPCVLPLLPVIIGGSVSADEKQKSRPYVIALSLAVSLVAFTLLLKVSTVLINVSPEVWTYVSGGLVLTLGLVSVFPSWWEKLAAKLKLQSGSDKLLSQGFKNKGRFIGPILIGAALGPVFSSCSPTYAYILATVLPRSALEGFVHLVAYSLGLVLVLLLVAIFGRKVIQRFQWAANPHGWFRRGIGIVFVVIGLLIITGYEKKFETWLVQNEYVGSTLLEQKIFNNVIEQEGFIENEDKGDSMMNKDETIFNVNPTPAPELRGILSWINSEPTSLEKLRGKVVLIDFWTYSCINCIRTLPYVEKWYEAYKDQGFVVIGVHAPEFAFEKKEENVRNAVAEYGLTYPIALDNDFATWRAFGNRYWPAHYLIDKDGNIRYTHFGEGEYTTTEKAIQELLGENKPLVTQDPSVSLSREITPETYFGIARAENYVGSPSLKAGSAVFQKKTNLSNDQWTLEGNWNVADDSITAVSDLATLTFRISAKDVYVVASSSVGEQNLKVSISDQNNFEGTDVNGDGVLVVDQSKLYHIAAFHKQQDATIELQVPKGVSLFTFTFGG